MRNTFKTCGWAMAGVIVVVAGVVPAAAGAAPPRYRVDVLPVLAPGWSVAYPSALSGTGTAVGYASGSGDAVRGWVWEGGAVRMLSSPTSLEGATFAADVNASGTVLGWVDVDGVGTPAVWSGELVTLLGRLDPGEYAGAYGMNDRGDVVGASVSTGLLWRDGVVSAVAPVAGTERAHPLHINNAGVMAGHAALDGSTRPARWVDGVGELLPVPDAPDGRNWFAFNVSGMNERGDVVGASFLNGGAARGFVWRDGVAIDLAPFDADAGSMTLPGGINDAGWVVGTHGTATDWLGTFLWIDGEMFTLRSLLEAEFAGVELLTANSINERGVIAATAWIDGAQTPVLLTPVPAPGATALLLSVGALAMLRRRR
jgi:probable HAF family extracellular repeat protein